MAAATAAAPAPGLEGGSEVVWAEVAGSEVAASPRIVREASDSARRPAANAAEGTEAVEAVETARGLVAATVATAVTEARVD